MSSYPGIRGLSVVRNGYLAFHAVKASENAAGAGAWLCGASAGGGRWWWVKSGGCGSFLCWCARGLNGVLPHSR